MPTEPGKMIFQIIFKLAIILTGNAFSLKLIMKKYVFE